ncbi:MAG TPA: hypothetical protein VHB50_01245 [Bryobacteraceae bacterium]|nr:hypothetical protein [Bryobacteraceae bacterium]
MSARNGDKARFGRLRKQRIHRRESIRALREHQSEASARTDSHEKKATGVLSKAARSVGSALGKIAAKTHLAGSAEESQR